MALEPFLTALGAFLTAVNSPTARRATTCLTRSFTPGLAFYYAQRSKFFLNHDSRDFYSFRQSFDFGTVFGGFIFFIMYTTWQINPKRVIPRGY
ncbi:hypothetical protein CCACVL1_03570 [Corchorus capsularis]|uniref:Uncharacterized protein n=1 Tax=Corchorus capsularis TaxID=210143 RepID=A0A1R3JYR2_COCAP|nr:hypothetical protein CCACVL1_03570 [Corchorus capsularis]